MLSKLDRAALIWDVHPQFLRIVLQQNDGQKKVPFGFAIKKDGNDQYNYYIEEYQLRQYVGEEKWQAGLERVALEQSKGSD